MRLLALLLICGGLIGCSSSPDIRGRNADARAWAESEQRDEAARKKNGTLPRTSKSVANPGPAAAPPTPPPQSATPPAQPAPAAH